MGTAPQEGKYMEQATCSRRASNFYPAYTKWG